MGTQAHCVARNDLTMRLKIPPPHTDPLTGLPTTCKIVMRKNGQDVRCARPAVEGDYRCPPSRRR